MSTPISKPADAIEKKVSSDAGVSEIDKAPDKNVDSVEQPDEEQFSDDPGKPI